VGGRGGMGARAAMLWALLCTPAAACGSGGAAGDAGPGDAADAQDAAVADAGAWTSLCDPDDPDSRGPACAWTVPTDADFDGLSIGPTGVAGWERATKYMVPADDDPTRIPPLVQNANRFPVHMDFLASRVLPGLDLATYTQMVNLRATRTYYAGNLVRIRDADGQAVYGFTIYTASKASEVLEPAEVRRVYDRLRTLVTAGPLAYTFEPFDAQGPAHAKAWIDPGFPIRFPGNDPVEVEVYTAGTAYGRVRRYALQDFEVAAAAGQIGYRDLVVVDSVPFDLEPVVAGVVTGGRQWELSHLNVRMARRGTPNLYVADPLASFAAWDGALVRLDAAPATGSGASDTYAVAAASEAEAQAWRDVHRPRLEDVPVPDGEYRSLDTLTAMDSDDDPVPLVSRFGGKAANLAKLYAFLNARYQVPGFGIPFSWFEAFRDGTTIPDARRSPPDEVTLREYVARLAADPAVATDTAYRGMLLEGLRNRIEEAEVAPDAASTLAARIAEVFGGTGVRVRFRSSSNVEDGLEFSGAGLYDSTTVCADDSLDADAAGPSACDATEPAERSVERGLRKVWASLYNDRAWNERDWYQVPQDRASMAILVTLGFPDERANGVAFTGDPTDPLEARYLVNAQVGDEAVVSNDPSKVPEKDLLEMTDGQVSWIARVRSSTLATPGVPVLSDDQLRELGGLMAFIDGRYPVDASGHARAEVLMDIEFKVQRDTNQLKLKQIRPFLRNTPAR
jgi:pyruvate, water dikinase